MQTAQNETTARVYAGLYVATQRQMRFWGWSSRGWGNLRDAELNRPVTTLAAWLRQAHERLDGKCTSLPASSNSPKTTASAEDVNESHSQIPSPKQRRLQFVCNRRMVGLLIR